MAEVRLEMVVSAYLPVDGQQQRTYWTRPWLSPFLPDIGEHVQLTEGGWSMEVKSRWWKPNGDVHLQLPAVYVDPPFAVPANASAWWTENEGGTPFESLQESGWAEGVR